MAAPRGSVGTCNVSVSREWDGHGPVGRSVDARGPVDHASVGLASSPGSLLKKTGGGESLVTSAGKVVDFRRLALAVPIRLQNETMCTRDILSTQQNIVNSKMNL